MNNTINIRGTTIKNPTDNDQIVWYTGLDDKYSVLVFRTAPYKGMLHIYKGLLNEDKVELNSKEVDLSYDARFGPDFNDVEKWKDYCIDFIDNKYESNRN